MGRITKKFREERIIAFKNRGFGRSLNSWDQERLDRRGESC